MVMDSGQFKTLQKVKSWRFDSAQECVAEKKQYLQKAETLVVETQQARIEFAAYRVSEKRRLYQEEADQGGVTLGKISTVNHTLSTLHQRLMTYQQKEQEATQQLAEAQLELQQARAMLLAAQRDMAKYDQVGEHIQRSQHQKAERLQEQEYEDFKTKPLF